MKASDLFVRCLEHEGVELIFGVPGEENADLMISLLDSRIRFVVCRHEQAAAFMADAWGRLTGRPACCLATLGPGATNMLTGVANATLDRSPLIAITGQASTTRMHKESHQVMDLEKLYEPCVKWTSTVRHPDAIPEIVRKAFRLAVADKPGACHIDLPENVAHMETLAQPIRPEPVARAAPNPGAVEEAAALLRRAKRPVILAGNGVLRAGASDALRGFARARVVPVANTFMGKGVIPPDDRLALYTVGLGQRDYPAAAIERADCVVAAGFDMVEYHPRLWNRGNAKTLIHVDASPAEIDDHYRTDVEIVGDPAGALEALTAATAELPAFDDGWWRDLRATMTEDLARAARDDAFPLAPQRILADLRAVLDDRDLVLSDVGAHKMWIGRQLHTSEPNTILISNGFCSMGFALPGAIGAKLACPDRRVVAVCGDGGLLMNLQDLETAVRERIPIVVMVWVDGEYALIRWKQELHFGRNSHTAFGNPDWMKLADAFGARGFEVAEPDGLVPALREALACDAPALVAVPVDIARNMELSRSLAGIPVDARCDCLDGVPLLAALPESTRRAIAAEMGEVRFADGETVFREGDRSDAVYVIHEGHAVVTRDGEVVRRVGPNGAFGDLAALSTEPRAATVTADGDLYCGTIDAEEFRELLRAQPEIAIELSAQLAKRLAAAGGDGGGDQG